MTKTIELRSNLLNGKLSAYSTYDYVFDIHDASKTLDLKSLNYNFEYNKYFQRIEVYINNLLIHSFLFPDVIDNKSPYYFIKDELLVSCENTIKFKFQRNQIDYDISDFKVSVNILPAIEKSLSTKSTLKISSLVSPVWKCNDFFNIEFDKTDSSKKIIFVDYKPNEEIIPDEVSLHIENQMYELICDKIRIGDTFEISEKDTIIYCRAAGLTTVNLMYLIEYHPIELN